MKTDLKDRLLNAFVIAALIAMLLIPFFNLIYFPTDETTSIFKLNGFDMMNAADFYEDAGVDEIETWAVMQWIFFIASIAVSFTYFLKENKDGFLMFVIVFCVAYCIFYLIQGIVIKNEMNEEVLEAIKIGAIPKEDKEDYLFKTAAFWPLVLILPCFIVRYIVDRNMLSEREKAYFAQKYNYQTGGQGFQQPQNNASTLFATAKTRPVTQGAAKPAPLSEEKKLEMLVKWKELLDSGVISQEDFEKKKKELI